MGVLLMGENPRTGIPACRKHTQLIRQLLQIVTWQDVDTEWGIIVSSHIVDMRVLDTKSGVTVSSHIVERQDLDTKWGVIVSSHVVDMQDLDTK